MLHSVTRDRRPSASATDTIRVASVPSSHVYVRHLDPAGDRAPAVQRLADPTPPGHRSSASPWWPPVMLDPAWILDHADAFDLFHVHFGFDACTPDKLHEVVEALRAAGRPLVFTVHDLRNPHHVDQILHASQLDVLVRAADAVITLTRGAADEIRRRWGRAATVVPHPHVVDLHTTARSRQRRRLRSGPFRIGIHLKSVRAGMDPAPVLPVLARAARELPGAVLQVNGHRELLEPSGDRYDPELARVVADLGSDVDVRVHDYFSDDELWAYLGSLDVSVLPYRQGTHSGWLEACRDLGTQVVASSCGYYADQAPVHTYVMDESSFDEDSLLDAVRRAHDRPAAPVDLSARRRQRDTIAEAHRAIYTRLLRA